MQLFELNNIIDDYRRSYNNYLHSYIKVNFKHDGIVYFPLKMRFTHMYHKYILAKLSPLKHFPLYVFATLTIRSTLETIELAQEVARKKWKVFRAQLAKCGIKKPVYIRSFEIGKNYNFHIHVSFFSDIGYDNVLYLARYWAKNVGFQKMYYYQHHEKRGNRTYAVELETWAEVIDDKMIITMINHGEREIGRKAINYVYKYSVKLPSLKVRALMWHFKVRTYSVSRSVSELLKIKSEEDKPPNRWEDDMAIDTHIVYKHEFSRLPLLRKEKFKKHMANRASKESYMIELSRTHDEFEKLSFHWYYLVKGGRIIPTRP